MNKFFHSNINLFRLKTRVFIFQIDLTNLPHKFELMMVKKRIEFFAKVLIAVILLIYLVKYVNYIEIINAIKSSNKPLVALVFLMSFLNIYVQFLKWEVVCNSILGIKNKNKILLSLFYGFSGGIATPARIGEYVARKFPFENTSLMKITIATIIEKFTSLFLVLVVGTLTGILFLYKYFSVYYAFSAILISALIVILFLFFIKGIKKSTKFVNYLTNKFKFFNDLFLELKYAKEIKQSSFILLVAYSVVFYFIYVSQYSILVLAFNNGGNFISAFWSGTLVMFVKSVLSFISFADLGIRESTSVFVLSKMNLSKAVGFNSAIFLFLFNVLIPSIIGLALLIRKQK